MRVTGDRPAGAAAAARHPGRLGATSRSRPTSRHLPPLSHPVSMASGAPLPWHIGHTEFTSRCVTD
jgi:hypothetical protein